MQVLEPKIKLKYNLLFYTSQWTNWNRIKSNSNEFLKIEIFSHIDNRIYTVSIYRKLI